jgi:putative ABC transport system substrate-binding protein
LSPNSCRPFALIIILFRLRRYPSPAATYIQSIAAVRKGIGEAGLIEGQSFNIEYRWANEHYDRLPALAAQLVQQHVAAIFATGSLVSAVAAKAATATIPIVFANGSDPVKFGVIASLAGPGGNITGDEFL